MLRIASGMTIKLEKLKRMHFHFTTTGDKQSPIILWAHGWGQSRAAFLPLSSSFERSGTHILLDLPGFGKTPAPHENWGTADYADAAAALIRQNNWQPVIWIGHSFGCRVGIQLAARHPELVRGMCLIAAAGLKPQRSLWKTLYLKMRIALFKTLRSLPVSETLKHKILSAFGSRDYMNAGPLRRVFVRVVNEDLSKIAQSITCPVTLIYGSKDTETPPEIGERLHRLIPQSKLIHLDGEDHYTVLGSARHQVTPHIKQLIESLS